MNRWPSVAVVLPVTGEATALEQTLATVQAQDYPGRMYVIVVFDQTEPQAPSTDGDRPVLALTNWRRAGHPGACNTGILAADADLVAFCEPSSGWTPSKLRAQVAALIAAPESELATCAVAIERDGRRVVRRTGRDRIGIADLIRSRTAMPHWSTIVARRGALLDPTRIGLFAERVPGGHHEDWDLLLRAVRRAPITHLDEPLARLRHSPVTATNRLADYAARMRSLRWMIARHPELRASRVGAARIYGQLACWSAASGDRQAAWRWTKQAMRNNWHEPRAAIALAALSRAVTVETVAAALYRLGRVI